MGIIGTNIGGLPLVVKAGKENAFRRYVKRWSR